jgi:diguanylate cyclase (GGDEF)-like protein
MRQQGRRPAPSSSSPGPEPIQARGRTADKSPVRGSSWIFPDGAGRERMLELDQQLQPVRRTAFAVLGLALIGSGPWLGWWTLLPLLLAAGGFRVADSRIGRLRRPEYALLAAWLASEAIMAVSVALSGGPRVPTTAWLAIPVLTLGARFSDRGIAIGVGAALGLLAAVELGVDAHAVVADPPLLIAPAALIVSVAMFQTVLMRSEIKLRSEVVVDSLTGMLNRRALARRVDELEQQARITRQPVGLIVADIDHFKQFNDTHGHAAGDALLTDISYQLRKTLRAFDLCYRTGGEEFVVLLPGADLDQAAEVANQLCRDIAHFTTNGRRATMSFGVAASTGSKPFHYPSVYAEADAALYRAKATGRNRVCLARVPSTLARIARPQPAGV